MTCLPEAAAVVVAAEAAAAGAGVVECAAGVAVAECVAAVAAAPFAVAEEGVPRWGAHLPCRDLPHLDPRWVGHPAATLPAVAHDRARVPAAAVVRIMETCRLPAVGQDLVLVPAAEIWRAVERDPAAHDRVEYNPAALGLVAHGLAARDRAAATWRVAARALAPVRVPAVVRRQVTWETFLISPAQVVAVHIVLVRVQRLPAAPQRSLPVVPLPISCTTDRRLNRALALAHVPVPAT
jgi:hypothetical protein